MNLLFFESRGFSMRRSDYLDDDGYRILQYALLENPQQGAMIPGSGGFRKLRWPDARKSKGKRGGLRIVYYYFEDERQVWFAVIFDKDKAIDLTSEEKRVLGAAVRAELKLRRQWQMKEKRRLFDDLMESVEDMRLHREGKITLRSHTLEMSPPLEIDSETIRTTRKKLKVSRAVFAHGLRVSPRTLENWEQGRAKPNAQAAALILMVKKYPDTFARLQSL